MLSIVTEKEKKGGGEGAAILEYDLPQRVGKLNLFRTCFPVKIMAQSLTDLFGASATQTGSTITIEFADFSDLDDPTTATPSQLCAAYLLWLRETSKNAVNDKEAGIAADEFQPEKSFVQRGETEPVSQIAIPIQINLYAPDTTAFDPDSVI